MGKLIIDGKSHPITDLVSGKSDFTPRSTFESEILDFIISWHRDNSRFHMSTSGSTGTPKTIAIKKESMRVSALKTAEAIGLTPGMIALLAMDPSYIAGKMMMARSLTLDMDLIVVEPSSNPLNEIDPGTKIDFTALVPFQLLQILEDGFQDRLNRMHAMLVGGGPISPSLAGEIEQLRVPVYHTYGMTETISHIALRRLNGKGKSENFKVLPEIQIGIDDRGCLVVFGGFLESPVVTNDMVELETGDTFRWLGRIDNVVNSGGVKLHPEIIESEILKIFESSGFPRQRMFLGGIPDEKLGERMVMFTEGEIDDHDKVLQLLKSKMGRYSYPKEIIVLDKFEETATGKLKRKEMIQKFISH